MGASGYGALEADCCDSVFKSMLLAEKNVHKILQNTRKYRPEEIRGLCYFVCVLEKAGFYAWDDKDELLKGCIKLLQQLLDDPLYTEDWKEPSEIKIALRRQIKDLRELQEA